MLTDEQRDSYGSPPEVYRYLDRRFHFVADMAASDENHLHPTTWFTKERSCLSFSWADHLEKHCNVKRWGRVSSAASNDLHPNTSSIRRFLKRRLETTTTESAKIYDVAGVPPFVYLNPPYSMPGEFLAKCAYECIEGGIGSVVLLKEQDGELYWAEHVAEKAAEVIHITGRLSFIHPMTKTPKQGNNFGSTLVIYDPRHVPGTPVVASWLSRQAFYAL